VPKALVISIVENTEIFNPYGLKMRRNLDFRGGLPRLITTVNGTSNFKLAAYITDRSEQDAAFALSPVALENSAVQCYLEYFWGGLRWGKRREGGRS
jgi:hypothetical protein